METIKYAVVKSEDLWSKLHDGKYKYCNIKGYILNESEIEPETNETHI